MSGCRAAASNSKFGFYRAIVDAPTFGWKDTRHK
jgi:hypothetical protein